MKVWKFTPERVEGSPSGEIQPHAPTYDHDAVVAIVALIETLPPGQQMDTLAIACRVWIERQAPPRLDRREGKEPTE